MIDIGLNYLIELDDEKNRYDKIYKFLIKNGYINTLKFPGKYCNYEALDYFLNIVNQTDAKIDIHGIPDMVPAISSKKFIKNINWKRLKKFFLYNKKINRISTHLGLEIKDKISDYKIEKNTDKNIKKIKEKIKKILKHNIEVGLENIPGKYGFDVETLKPEYVSNMWEISDFGVFDITHAKIASEELGIDYEEYIKKLKNKEKVKILHIAGDIDEHKKYINKPDKHILINKNEIKDILEALNIFKNLDLVVTEYGYNTKYSYEKELIIEAITVNTILKTKNEEKSIKILEYLEENLKEDISNIQELIESEELKNLNNTENKNEQINKYSNTNI